jgi:hypothetical protein
MTEDDRRKKLQKASVHPPISKPSYSLLDPNPSLIDKDGKLNNTNLAASLTTYRNGTIADGVSKLILIADSKNPLQFSINDTKPDNLTNEHYVLLINHQMLIAYPLLSMVVLSILVMENQLLLLYILLQTPLIKLQEVKELSTLMSQIQVIQLVRFLKFQYTSIVLLLFSSMACGGIQIKHG